MIHFFFIVNKQCQTRFARYYDDLPADRPAFEMALGRQCIVRKPGHTLFFDNQGQRIVYRAYSSLYFIIGCDATENEFAMLELIQNCVETLDTYFEKVTELDLVYNLEKVHLIMDELILKGLILETNQERVLSPVFALTHPARPSIL